MKILLLGDASNYHNALGQALMRMGHDVTVASHGSRWMNTGRDIDLSRKNGKLGGAMLYFRLRTTLVSRLKGYDVVQLVNPIFVDLKPHRVREVFKVLKRNNGSIFLTALGTDTAYVEMALAKDNPLRYTEWAVDGAPTPFALSARGDLLRQWLHNPLYDHARMIYDNVDGVVSALYEYHLSMSRYIESDRLAYGGIPIELSDIPFAPYRSHSGPIRVMAPYHAGREQEKGTDKIFEIVRDMANIEIDRVTGLPFDNFRESLRKSDIILDQYYSYTPATTALMAMAMGKIVVTGAETDFESFVGEPVPAINVSPFDHSALKKTIVQCAVTLPTVSEKGEVILEGKTIGGLSARQFVERNNSADVVARRFVDFWTSRLR